MQFAELEQATKEEFTELLSEIYEHSPWIAAAAVRYRPFLNLAELHLTMSNIVISASYQQQLDLILAHPELAGKAAAAGNIAQASKNEQKGAGLDQCSPAELEQIQGLNQAYQEKFGFPFIIAVKGLNRSQIINAMQSRLNHDRETEFNTALEQINQIALIRLHNLFPN